MNRGLKTSRFKEVSRAEIVVTITRKDLTWAEDLRVFRILSFQGVVFSKVSSQGPIISARSSRPHFRFNYMEPSLSTTGKMLGSCMAWCRNSPHRLWIEIEPGNKQVRFEVLQSVC